MNNWSTTVPPAPGLERTTGRVPSAPALSQSGPDRDQLADTFAPQKITKSLEGPSLSTDWSVLYTAPPGLATNWLNDGTAVPRPPSASVLRPSFLLLTNWSGSLAAPAQPFTTNWLCSLFPAVLPVP